MEQELIKQKNRKNKKESFQYYRTKMQKDIIIQKLKEKGCRITKQRLMLLDIILQEDCSCCKEIYFKASQIDSGIGTATIYRMVNTLEEIGAISRKNMYKIVCEMTCEAKEICIVEFDDGTVLELSTKRWHQIVEAGLTAYGYIKNRNIRSVKAKTYRREFKEIEL
ncbi:MAG: Fur family transcriptional regulator [Lachnospiraceae bacterium]|jgi:Fur family ferric uptake transcriptional regulator|nr:Fur family transcriptional regulator [Lachnospiraceae bacterium]